LRERGIAFRSLSDAAIDTTTTSGKLVFNLFAVLADFERELIRDRTRAGLAVAKARGRSGGRRPVITPAKLARAQKLMKTGLTAREAAAAIGVGKTALYNALRQQEQDDE
jgi:DNA invertase Pin-like site-specific DNA recombinase